MYNYTIFDLNNCTVLHLFKKKDIIHVEIRMLDLSISFINKKPQ
jgi:hypothetical protein